MSLDHKQAAAAHALGLVEDGMRLGLGTGSTAAAFVRLLGARVRAERLDLICVPTSRETEALAAGEGLRLAGLDEAGPLDMTVDGADEIDPGLNLLKGGGGALLREKIVAAASRRMVVIADETKAVARLGRFPLPLEVSPFAPETTLRLVLDGVSSLGLPREGRIRTAPDGTRVVTDDGGHLIDLSLGAIPEPHALATVLGQVPGVAGHGLFLGLATTAILAGPGGVRVLDRPEA